MVWFDESDNSDNSDTLSRQVDQDREERTDIFKHSDLSWFDSESPRQEPKLELGNFPSQAYEQRYDNTNKDPYEDVMMTIPMYPVFVNQKGNGLKPSLIREQANLPNGNFLEKMKMRVY